MKANNNKKQVSFNNTKSNKLKNKDSQQDTSSGFFNNSNKNALKAQLLKKKTGK
ncbi:hypothetical protein G7062_03075 [Erysipelothrix sp. HDW6C]|uniref:hypothetical protein n=1 Tax=Erysipelothrix sp. HDW6C TaxID=2714930 RepID=UPI00140B13BC|nr:hypothetical protein [Erysipelothrix sp. HDW6C]QIK69337.1 hypothetical protein G7062_03075 [Erysipelothrix sp. HDW6C]